MSAGGFGRERRAPLGPRPPARPGAVSAHRLRLAAPRCAPSEPAGSDAQHARSDARDFDNARTLSSHPQCEPYVRYVAEASQLIADTNSIVSESMGTELRRSEVFVKQESCRSDVERKPSRLRSATMGTETRNSTSKPILTYTIESDSLYSEIPDQTTLRSRSKTLGGSNVFNVEQMATQLRSETFGPKPHHSFDKRTEYDSEAIEPLYEDDVPRIYVSGPCGSDVYACVRRARTTSHARAV